MSVAAPKSQAKEPIQLDIVIVCRKQNGDGRPLAAAPGALATARRKAARKLEQLASVGLALSRNDRRIAVISQFLAELGPVRDAAAVVDVLETYATRFDDETGPLVPLEEAATPQAVVHG
jgi:putative DNA methylase